MPFWCHFGAFGWPLGYPWEPFGCLWVAIGFRLESLWLSFGSLGSLSSLLGGRVYLCFPFGCSKGKVMEIYGKVGGQVSEIERSENYFYELVWETFLI